MPIARWVAAAALVAWGAAPALAHKPSDSYLTLRVEGTQVLGQWDIALRDLDDALDLDANRDGELTWGEVRARHADIASLALASLAIASDRRPCEAKVTGHQVDRHSDGAYAVLRLEADCGHAPASLDLRYSLFFAADAMHRGLAQVDALGTNRALIFSAERPEHRVVLATPARWSTFSEYVREGVWHIWIGFDHILFLLCLLLPAVLVRIGRDWRPSPDWQSAAWEIFAVVTAFTVAHSITLSAAAFGLVSLPSRWVESAIALSVVAAALNNLRPILTGWPIAFAFGLVHGLGFASVLADLGLPRDNLVLALLGFNVGVELGQLAIVAAFFPLAFAIRSRGFYRRVVLSGGSAVMIMVAAVWFAERAFDVPIITF